MKKFVAHAGLSVAIADEHATKPGFGGKGLGRILVLLLEHFWTKITSIRGQPEISGIVHLVAGEGVIIEPKIRPKILRAHKNLDAIVNPVNVLAEVGEDQEVRAIANLHLKLFSEEIVNKIVGFQKTGVKIAKIKSDFNSHLNPPSLTNRHENAKALRPSCSNKKTIGLGGQNVPSHTQLALSKINLVGAFYGKYFVFKNGRVQLVVAPGESGRLAGSIAGHWH
jgi:hypothetical protein